MKIAIWHNIMWSRYKAVVFSSIYRRAQAENIPINFYQIAETDANRAGLSPIDQSWHDYPFTLLFKGASSGIPSLKLLWKAALLTWRDPADIVILSGYERPVVWLQALILSLKRRPFALFCDSTLYDQPQTFWKGIAKRIIFNWADGIFCYGVRAVEYVGCYGVPSSKSFVRCQAAALPKDYSAAKALEQRVEKAPRNAPPRYLYVGRLSPEKSLDHLLVAFKQVVASGSGAQLVLVGKGSSEQELRDLATQLGLEKDVIFAGPKFDSELFEEYSKASCLVLPSYSEPWGLVVNEALSHGCPVIVSYRCGCVPELVNEGRTGFSFEWGDVNQLSEKMGHAPKTFSDIPGTARACFAQIAPFTPDAAAKSIINGCLTIFNERA
ncbi:MULTISPECIES: glycosyltransferase [unclassified Bradyrhizobium]|uniref:glycosyltransferase n=1 Tax=unclassified Bradyrhizobium TaxID=2631580 RepID=UPI001FFAAFA6|nr:MULTISPECIES: glycosyltransferase [unclassified Bradyrhizobium]MCK1518868.1 glycosyltransferase family 4 protein [Bradyrhizobium sp. 17]MCK1684604.1 glycosyltransferase family 4 protein [Bradyrhizobium sp. 145]